MMADEDVSPTSTDAANPYRRLPKSTKLSGTVASHEADPAPDPNGGRDPETDFMLRHAN